MHDILMRNVWILDCKFTPTARQICNRKRKRKMIRKKVWTFIGAKYGSVNISGCQLDSLRQFYGTSSSSRLYPLRSLSI